MLYQRKNYMYPPTLAEEKRITYLRDFASWLKRESSVPTCNNFRPTNFANVKQAQKELKACKTELQQNLVESIGKNIFAIEP